MLKWSEKIFIALTVLFCVNLALTNIVSVNLFQFPFLPFFVLSVGDLTYPVTFLVTDVISEIWGARRANFIVLLGFFTNVFMFFVIQAVLKATPHEYWGNLNNPFGFEDAQVYQAAYESVFSTTFFLVLASMIAYLVSQLLDVRTFHYLKKKTDGKYLWLRNNVSTITSQLVDTSIFGFIFLYLGLGLSVKACIHISIFSYSFKSICAIIDTPICYLIVRKLKKVFKKRRGMCLCRLLRV